MLTQDLPFCFVLTFLLSFEFYVNQCLHYILNSLPDALLYIYGDFNTFDSTLLSNLFNLKKIFENNVNLPTCCDAFSHHFKVTTAPSLGNVMKSHDIVFITRDLSSNANDFLFSCFFCLQVAFWQKTFHSFNIINRKFGRKFKQFGIQSMLLLTRIVVSY